MQATDAEGITAGKTAEELTAMLLRPQDWQPSMLDAARLELQKRNLPVPESPQQATPNKIPSIWSFHGRTTRSGFWAISLSLMVFNLLVGVVVELLGRSGSEPVGLAIDLVFLVICVWISLATQVKRWHDLNRPGWMVLLNLTVIALPVILAFLGFIRGTRGANRFGVDPLA